MAKEVRIPVPGGLMTHGGPIFEVVLKEPTYDAYIEFGDISTYGKAPDGTLFVVENAEILRAYITKCLVQPADPLALGQGGLELARAVKGAVLGFFQDAPSKGAQSPISETTSSLDAVKDVSTL